MYSLASISIVQPDLGFVIQTFWSWGRQHRDRLGHEVHGGLDEDALLGVQRRLRASS